MEVQRFNGGKKENRMISQGQAKERQLSRAECDMQRDQQPATTTSNILEFKAFVLFVCVSDLSWLRGFQPFQVLEPKSENLSHSGTKA